MANTRGKIIRTLTFTEVTGIKVKEDGTTEEVSKKLTGKVEKDKAQRLISREDSSIVVIKAEPKEQSYQMTIEDFINNAEPCEVPWAKSEDKAVKSNKQSK